MLNPMKVEEFRKLLETVPTATGAAIRKKREELGWSQQELAEALKDAGVSWHQTTVAKVERGERPLKMTEAVAVAYALGMVKLDEVLGDNSSPVQSALVYRFRVIAELGRSQRKMEMLNLLLSQTPPAMREEVEAVFWKQMQEIDDVVQKSAEQQPATSRDDLSTRQGQGADPDLAQAFRLADEIHKEADDG